jgi:hypothetical protein
MLPSTLTAPSGLAGQTYSQAPQPMQRSVSTTGRLRVPSGPARLMAPGGQAFAQAVQETSSVVTMQISGWTMALPTWVALLRSTVMGLMAPAGQTEEQMTQLTRQYPRSKSMTGCRARPPISEECNI